MDSSKIDFSRKIQTDYMLLEQMYGIKEIDPKYLAPNAIEIAKSNLIFDYKGLIELMTEDELKGIRDPLVELIFRYEKSDEAEKFKKALEDISK